MVRKYIKFIIVFVLLFSLMISMLNTYSTATDYNGKMLEEMKKVDVEKETEASKSVNNVVSAVITIARIIGVTVAIVMILAVAMKYMTAAPGEKADIKKSAVVYIVGAIVLFAVTGILGIINDFSKNITA